MELLACLACCISSTGCSQDDDPAGVVGAQDSGGPCDLGAPNDEAVLVVTDQGRKWCVDRYEAAICDGSLAGRAFEQSCISRPNGNNFGRFVPGATQDLRDEETGELQHDDGPDSPLDQRIANGGRLIDPNYRAFSQPGLVPTVYVTPEQARAACENSGKQVIPDEVWRQAFKGTHDPGDNDGSTNARCNTNTSAAAGARATGLARSRPADPSESCVSSAGVEDMLANVWDLVAVPSCDDDPDSVCTASGFGLRGGSYHFGASAIDEATRRVPVQADLGKVGGGSGIRCARPLHP